MASLAQQLGQNINQVLGPQNTSQRPYNIIGSQFTSNTRSLEQAKRFQLKGIRQATGQLEQGFNQSSGFLRQSTADAIGALRPLTAAGQGALARFSKLNQLNGQSGEEAFQELQNSEDYKFRFEQGLQAARTGLNAAGVQGGRALEELQQLGQQMASQELDNVNSRLLGLISLAAPAFSQEASLQSGLGTQLAGLRSQLSSDLADASLSAGGVRASTALQAGSTLKLYGDQSTLNRLSQGGYGSTTLR